MNVTVFGCDPDEEAVFRERAPFFGITPIITAAPVTEDTVGLVGGSRSISVGHKWPISNEHLTALSRAGVDYISTRSIGHNHLDVAHAESVGITVESVLYSPASVADYTLMLILMALRHAKPVLLNVNAHDYRLGHARGHELRDLTVGVVGTGRIGTAVIDRLRGFGCRILATDRRRAAEAEYLPLNELLQRSDVVTLHTPLDESSHHLLDAKAFEQMKKGAVVINTGRGSLIDTAALLTALESGTVGGAALDVVEGEEGIFYADHRHQPITDGVFARLHRLSNVIVTPHTAYYTEHALKDTVVNSLINCLRFEKGLQYD
ncbi:MAG TPA: NAD(P)-dependent oxidoreductase [Pseudolysinimonas sp.]|nr:NAD(P)-dependent oxidoreductase [Pseudolysinimonas sp.]